jgi:16S rRNA processing protein RimM
LEIIIGKVVSVNIPKAELRIAPETSHPERFYGLNELSIKPRKGPTFRLMVRGLRSAGTVIVATVETGNNEALASARKALVVVPRTDRFPLPENEYYIDDIVGLVVKDVGGAVIGRLARVLETPANDVYQVIDDAGREFLLPAIEDVILNVDIERGELTADVSNLI